MMLSCLSPARLRRTMGWLWPSLLLIGAFGVAKAQESDPYGALQYQYTQRAFPYNGIDSSAFARALAQRERMAPARMGSALASSTLTGGILPDSSGLSSTWSYLGPNDLLATDNTYNGPGQLSGRVNAAAFDPADSTGNTIYVAAATGGLWKTTNGGATWTPLSDSWPSLQVSSIAIDPNNHNNVYVGTGDFPSFGIYGFGLMKSTDGGNSWTNLGASQFGNCAVSSIAIAPENSSIITVATGNGTAGAGYVWRSTNGGSTWTKMIGTSAEWSVVTYGAYNSSTNGRWLYASGQDNGGEVWRSGDYGATWTRLTLPTTSYYQKGLCIATSPTNPAAVYLLSGHDRKIWASTNAGSSWTSITSNFTDDWRPVLTCYALQCASHNGADVLYVGITDLTQSTNGGSSWHAIGGPANGPNALIHIHQHYVAVDPNNPNDLLICNDGGVYRLAYNPSTGACVFTSLSTHLPIGQIYRASYHPTDPNYILSGSQGASTIYSFDTLNAWLSQNTGDGGCSAINPSNDAVQFLTFAYLGFRRTSDAWVSQYDFTPTTNGQPMAYIAPMVMDPNNSSTIYAATNYLYRWNDNNWSWTANLGGKRLATKVGTAQGVVLCIAVAPSDSSRIYTGSDDGEVWMTSNGGSIWTQINSGSPSLPARAVTSIAVNPSNENAILVGLSGTGSAHVWACNNTTAGSRIWANLSGSGTGALPDIPVNTIALDPANYATTYYIGTDIGVFQTTNGGTSWSNATGPLGLPNVQVNDLKAVPGSNYLFAATWGRGIWRITLATTEQVNSIAVNPSTVQGTTSVTGTVFISMPAPSGGLAVSLSSSDSSAASVPSSITVPAGQTSATFTIKTYGVAQNTNVTITAGYNGGSKQTALSVLAPTPSSLAISPSSVTGGGSAKGTVTLNSPAPSNGIYVVLSSNNSYASVPSKVFVSGGATSASFTITTTLPSVNQEATIGATYNNVTQQAYLVIFK
ncbi:MAG TPA: hypothetical protein VFA07_02265 [Chthonomonadaceae bacterium]|nr:hypothetical protein [Chthonomonadaceae bacterium]